MGIFTNLFKKQKALEAPKKAEENKNKLNLQSLYQKCVNFNENKILDEIKRIKQTDIEIEEEEIEKIIAKKIASNYSRFGTSNFDVFSTYLPLTKMIERKIPEIVELEYSKIKNPERKLPKEEVKKLAKENIVGRIAKKVGAKYNTEKALEIPQAISSLKPQEKDYFIECVHKEVGDEEFSTFQEAILSIKMMKHGTEAAEKTENLIASIQTEEPENIATIAEIGASMANDEEQLEVHKAVDEIGFDQETMDIVAKLVDTGVIENLKELSEDEQNKTIEVINGQLERVVKNKEKVQEEKQAEQLEKNEDEER